MEPEITDTNDRSDRVDDLLQRSADAKTQGEGLKALVYLYAAIQCRLGEVDTILDELEACGTPTGPVLL